MTKDEEIEMPIYERVHQSPTIQARPGPPYQVGPWIVRGPRQGGASHAETEQDLKVESVRQRRRPLLRVKNGMIQNTFFPRVKT